MEIVYSKVAIKTLRTMDEKTRLRVKSGVDAIPAGDIKPLHGTQNTYRLRIGDWRILFSYKDAGNVLVSKISPRGDAYKGM